MAQRPAPPQPRRKRVRSAPAHFAEYVELEDEENDGYSLHTPGPRKPAVQRSHARRRPAASHDRNRKSKSRLAAMLKARTAEDGAVPTVRYGATELYERPLHELWHYAAERQRLFHRWRVGRPHTHDAELATGKFCNIFRYTDRASVWLIVNVLGPLREAGRVADLLFNVIIFRCFLTWERSMAHMCSDGAGRTEPFCAHSFDADDFGRRAARALAALGKLGRSPYTVHPLRHLARPEDEHKKTPQYVRLFRIIAPQMESLAQELLAEQSSVHTWRTIRRVLQAAMGQACTFSLYQVCLDVGYAYPSLFNESQFVHVGGSSSTGAQGGIQWVFKNKGGLSDEDCVRLLQREQRAMFQRAGIPTSELLPLFGGFPRPPCADDDDGGDHKMQEGGTQWRPLNLMAVEGCLCEINKKLNRAYQVNGGRGGKCFHGNGCDSAHRKQIDRMFAILRKSWGGAPSSSSSSPTDNDAPASVGNSGLVASNVLAGRSTHSRDHTVSHSDSEDDGTDEWVQCEAPGCGKWLLLPPHVRAASVPERFVCALNTWDRSIRCGDVDASRTDDDGAAAEGQGQDETVAGGDDTQQTLWAHEEAKGQTPPQRRRWLRTQYYLRVTSIRTGILN
jgi:hypothetical protein